jgi:hypothetical protein
MQSGVEISNERQNWNKWNQLGDKVDFAPKEKKTEFGAKSMVDL